jgi:hypothetical protein
MKVNQLLKGLMVKFTGLKDWVGRVSDMVKYFLSLEAQYL